MSRLAAVAALLSIMVAAPAFAQGDTAIPSGPQQKDEYVVAGPRTVSEMNARLEELFGESAPFEEAFRAIKAAFAADDRDALAEWVSYPFRVSYDDQELVIENEQDFVDNYDDIVTEDIVEAVAAQEYQLLFANSDGVMFGDGQVWMTPVCEDEACTKSDVRIIAIQSVLQ